MTVGHDYDADGDGLIGISNLAQLDAVRYDLDGDGYAGTVAAYAAAFPSPLDRLGCGVDGCSGYELLADLDFDTNNSGDADAGDTYWNAGDGWEPIGWDSTYEFARFFDATFDGNEHTLSNLFTTGRGYAGLFSAIGLDGLVGDLTLSDVNVSGTEAAGALVGENQGRLYRLQSSGASSRGASRRGTGRAQSEACLPLSQLCGGHGNEAATASRHRRRRYFRGAGRHRVGWSVTTPVSSS